MLDGLDLFANRKQISLSELLNEDISLKSNIFNYSMLSLGGYLYDDDKRTLYVPDLFNINLSGTEKKKKKLENALSLESFKDIKIDDYLVHVNFEWSL